MIRRLIACSIGCLTVVLSAGGAQAKGELHAKAVVSGPGLSAPIVVTGKDADQLALGWVGAWWAHAPPYALGPRFSVVWSVRYPRPENTTLPGGTGRGAVRFDFYPYAKSGPWAHVPLGQHDIPVGVMPVEHEWYSMPWGSLDVLERHGLPPPVTAPAPTDPSRGGALLPVRSDPPWTAPVLAGILLLLIIIGTLSARRGNRRGAEGPSG